MICTRSISKNAIETARPPEGGPCRQGLPLLYGFAHQSGVRDSGITAQLAALEGRAKFGFWEKYDDTHTVMRIATSWATRMEEIEQLIALM